VVELVCAPPTSFEDVGIMLIQTPWNLHVVRIFLPDAFARTVIEFIDGNVLANGFG
jgi:hypothetical protein